MLRLRFAAVLVLELLLFPRSYPALLPRLRSLVGSAAVGALSRTQSTADFTNGQPKRGHQRQDASVKDGDGMLPGTGKAVTWDWWRQGVSFQGSLPREGSLPTEKEFHNHSRTSKGDVDMLEANGGIGKPRHELETFIKHHAMQQAAAESTESQHITDHSTQSPESLRSRRVVFENSGSPEGIRREEFISTRKGGSWLLKSAEAASHIPNRLIQWVRSLFLFLPSVQRLQRRSTEQSPEQLRLRSSAHWLWPSLGRGSRRRLQLKWLNDAWVKGAVFRKLSGSSEVSASLLGDGAEGEWVWPKGLFGDAPGTPFARGFPVSVKTESCDRGLIPFDAFNTVPPPAYNESDVHGEDLGKEYTTAPHYFIWLPRFGLGNTLRGYCSSYHFALLAGRRLARWHGGAHAQVLDLLCSSFECGGASLANFTTDIRRVSWLMNPKRSGKQMEEALHDTIRAISVTAGHFFGGFWQKNKQLKQCLYDALGCSSEWCANSRAVHLLLRKGGTPTIGRLIEQIIRRHDPGEPPAAGLGGRRLREGALQGRAWDLDPEDSTSGQESRRHLEKRRRPKEGSWGKDLSLRNLSDAKGPKSLLKQGSDLSGELTSSAEEGSLSSGGRREGGRRLGESKGGEWSVPPGMGLKLQFDVAVHVRAQPKVVENAPCHHRSAECIQTVGMVKEADRERLHFFVDPVAWACMAQLLQHLRQKKAESLKLPGGANATSLSIFLATDSEELRPRLLEYLEPFGDVYYSTGSVAHTSKSKDEESKLQTMTEFYLLSRAYVMVSFNKYVSTFAMFASMYSNATLLAREPQPDPNQCHFKVHHLGEVQK